MTRFEELKRIQAAIQNCNEAELKWADDYCQMQVREAAQTGQKSYWKGIQRDVDKAQRQLSVTPDHITAHRWSSFHHSTLMKSDACGCFYCLEIFAPETIEDWTDDEDTALRPKCGIDSVIGSASGYPIEREFLVKMHDYWF